MVKLGGDTPQPATNQQFRPGLVKIHLSGTPPGPIPSC